MKRDTINTRYQDEWVRGETIQKGERHCEGRYAILQQFMRRYQKPISVLDFGANHGYFSFRTAWDHPCWNVTMVDSSEKLAELKVLNNLGNVQLINKYMSFEDLKEHLQRNHYDLILMMSVLHHFENPEEVIDFLIQQDSDVIFEISYPREKTYANQHLAPRIYHHLEKYNPIQINFHITHDRPIYYHNNEKHFYGRVHHGAGVNGKEVYPAIKNELEKVFKCRFYPGSLNLTIMSDDTITQSGLSFQNPLILHGIRFYPMYIGGLHVIMMRGPEIDYPTNEIEVLSPINLRKYFYLKDWDIVSLGIDKKYLEE